MFKKKKFYAILLAIILLGGSFIYIHNQSSGNPVRYITATATKGEITVTVSASGTVIAQKLENANFSAAGIVGEVDVKPGDHVTSGQQIAKLDLTNSSLQTQLQSTQNALQTAKNNLASAQANPPVSNYQISNLQVALTNAQNALSAGQANTATTSEQLATLEGAVTTAQNNLSQAQQQQSAEQYSINNLQIAVSNAEIAYQTALTNYNNATLKSNIDGVVTAVNINPGDSISGTVATSNTSSTTSSAHIQIIDPSSLAASIQVAEADIAKVAVGQNVQLSFTALGTKTYVGTVESIAASATTQSNVTSFTVIVSINKPDASLKLGMSANANIIAQTKDNIITVPSTAIQTVNGSQTVQILKNNVAQTVVVTTGLTNGTDTEITSGINEGDTVITATITQSTTSSSSTGTNSSFGGGTGRGLGGGQFITRF